MDADDAPPSICPPVVLPKSVRLASAGTREQCPYACGGDWDAPPLERQHAAEPPPRPAARLRARRRRLAAPKRAPPSELRRLYGEGLLPFRVCYGLAGACRKDRGVGWLCGDVLALDLGYYAALCLDALHEPSLPYGFLACEAFVELVYAGGPAHRCAALAPAVAPPLKRLLRNPPGPEAARRALVCVHAFATCDAKSRGGLGVCGRALPLASLAQAVEFARKRFPALRSYADTVLEVLELHGGPAGLAAIQDGVRTYVSREGPDRP